MPKNARKKTAARRPSAPKKPVAPRLRKKSSSARPRASFGARALAERSRQVSALEEIAASQRMSADALNRIADALNRIADLAQKVK